MDHGTSLALTVDDGIRKNGGNVQITRLKMVLEECARDLGDEGALHIEGYYHHEGGWRVIPTTDEANLELGVELSRCSLSKGPYRSKNSRFSNFALGELRAVVRAEFVAPLRKATLEAMQRVVLRAYRNASNAFAVKYNVMTGLLAKTAFHQLVEQRLDALVVSDAPAADLQAAESSSPALCLLAIDIDHFKQVNDSYGHAYGDLVLRAFAMRLEDAVRSYCQSRATKIEASCAHVSGEEFFCVAWGDADGREFESLAECVLEAMRDSPLPSENEMDRLRTSSPQLDLSLPAMSNRRITCSIGGVIHGVPTSRDSQISASKLINQADVALYKSKNQGRDRTTFFATILQTGGRVIEHRPEVHVCILDIGSDVGVTKGQEFVVFHPEFTGREPYIRDDGRSKKVLGKLPRVSLCTITAFDVQRDISFCRVSDERFLQIPIPPNAQLEAIPLGTLSAGIVSAGTIWSEDEAISSVANIAETHQRISGEIEPSDERSFVVVGIRNEGQLLSDHGTAAVNRALATACRHLQAIAGTGGFLGQVEATKLLLQLKSFGSQERADLEAALEKTEKDNGGRAKFVAGVFAGNFAKRKNEPELPTIGNVRARADLARFAASPEGVLERQRIHIFVHGSASFILARLYKAREFQRGLSDYERFTEIGISGPYLDNFAGLCAYSIGNMQRAESLFLSAVKNSPSTEIVYRLNALSSQLHQGNIAAASQTAESVDREILEKEYRTYPFGAASFATAIAERALASGEATPVANEIMWIRRVSELDLPEMTQVRLRSLLRLLEERRDAG